MLLYGSTHTHFDSFGDTGNKLPEMIDEFVKAGAKRVAVTEHGDMTSFEELKDICAKKTDEEKHRLIDVIPGTEGYFNTTKDDALIAEGKEDKDHLILIAKDETGYRYLSNIVTQANVDHDNQASAEKKKEASEKRTKGDVDDVDNGSKARPIITWKNLEDNVKEPGHLYCTSACVAGPFGRIFEDEEKEHARILSRLRARIPFSDEEIDRITSSVTLFDGMSDKEKKLLSDDEKKAFQKDKKIYNSFVRTLNRMKEVENTPVSFRTKEEKMRDAKALYDRFTSIFGESMFFLEIQNHDIDKEQEIYPGILSFAKEYGLTDHLIASNDIHVGKTDPTEDDFIRRNVSQFNRYKVAFPIEEQDRELYIKSDEALKKELLKLPYDGDDKEVLVDTAIKNIETLLSSCEVDYIYAKGKDHYPKFTDDENALFDKLVDEGKKIKFPDGFPDDRYEKRLEHEKDVIKSMGYAGYHLIVQDYLNYGRNLGYLPKEEVADAPLDLDELKKKVKDLPKEAISIGPGRGSGVGSLCCYLLGITDIDPLKYDLLFERFLNPERVSMPDIDADFRTDIRQKCVDHCAYKYGAENVSKIMTKTFTSLKENLRIAARYLGTKDWDKNMPPVQKAMSGANGKKDFVTANYVKRADAIARKVENVNKKDILPDAEVKALNGIDKDIYELAVVLDGLHTAFGEHAAGNIISGDRIADVIPLRYNAGTDDYSTQCTMNDAEARGLLKMDFLGLDNLDILTECMQGSHDTIINDYSARDELLKDKAVMQHIFDKGLTQGVFQFESDGMKKMLKDFHPDTFEDLILLVAAYRPGPMQYLPEIIARKQHMDDPVRHPDEPKKTIDIDNPVLNEILAPTYGCMIYQEQVMKVCTDLSGYSLGQADIVRKAMSKKHLDEIEKERKSFIYGDPERNIEGCMKKSGLTEKEGNALFDQMCAFASYAFNKSHATAYALISYFTAYYKDRYPALFYAVSLNHLKKLDELAAFRSEMSSFGVALYPPTEGHSKADFVNEGNKVWFGFGKIKGLPTGLDISGIRGDSVEELLYENPDVSTKVLSALIRTGMFDALGNRAALDAYVSMYREKLIKGNDASTALEPLLKKKSAYEEKFNEYLSYHPELTVEKFIKIKDKSFQEYYHFAEYKEVIKEIKKLQKTVEKTDIPSFLEYEKTYSSDKTKEKEEEYALLGTVFFDDTVMKALSQYPAFSDLPEEKYKKKECAFYCIGTEKKEYHSKFDDSTYYAADFMDKDYKIKRYFVSFPMEAGLYTGRLSQYPFSAITRDQKKDVFIKLDPRDRLSACVKVTDNEKRQGVVNRLASIQARNPGKARYCTIYTGTEAGEKEIPVGHLDREEFKAFVKTEREEHDTEFLYGDEMV